MCALGIVDSLVSPTMPPAALPALLVLTVTVVVLPHPPPTPGCLALSILVPITLTRSLSSRLRDLPHHAASNTTFQEFAIFPFSKSHQQVRESCTEIFWVVSASQLWLAPLLVTFSDECTVSRGRTADFFFFGCVVVSKVRSRFAAPPFHQLSPASVRSFFALEELSFNEPRREKTIIFIGCVSPA